MADANPEVRIKISSDTVGGEKAERTLRRTGKASKDAASQSKGAFDSMTKAVGGVNGAFSKLRLLLSGFGIGAFVGMMNAGLAKVVNSFGASRKAAEDLAAVQRRLAEDTGIADLVTDYAKLTDAIKATADAENHQLEMIDLEVANRRKLEDARIDSAKEDEIAKLDENAADYNLQLDRIEKKYAALKAQRDASNAKEDIVLQRQKMNAQADQTAREADAEEANAKSIRARINQAQRDKMRSDTAAVELNENDKTGVFTAIGKTLGQLFSGEWGRMGEAKTAAGDAVRKTAAEQSAALEKSIMALTEELRRSNARADGLRRSATATREKAGMMDGAIAAAEISGTAAIRSAARGVTSADRALAKDASKRATEADALSRAKSQKASVESQIAFAQAQLGHVQDQRIANNQRLATAGDAYDAAVANGASRNVQRDAYAQRQRTIGEVNNANAALDRSEASLQALLQALTQRLNKLNSVVEQGEKRTKTGEAN